jgi:ATP-dependent DNA ligase
VKGDRKTPLPTWVKPQLAALVKQAPDRPDWAHEIKLDGYRMHARLDGGRVKILTRRGHHWTEKYPSIAKALTSLPADTAYLDGELCGVLPDGRTAFNLMQNAMEHGDASLIFFAFDLLHLDGENLTALPLIDRKARLEALLAILPPDCDITITRSTTARYSTGWPVSTPLKALSRRESMAATSPTADPG